MLSGKKVLLGISGSIAAYKAPLIVRLLIKGGAEVKVIMTPAARDFVTSLTLSTVSKNPVTTDLYTNETWSNHVMLGRWADIMLIAPLTCNTLAKMSHGLCDNMLLATYLSATCPVAVAPAMDEDMWNHGSTKENLQKLEDRGNNIIPVEYGELASGLTGNGRMAEPEHIIRYLEQNFFLKQDLQGKKVLVTAGPTYEPIDPVRYIGNRSSGKMGIAISEELASRGANVHLIIGPSNAKVSRKGITIRKVETAQQMFEACVNEFKDADIAIMSAAVSDFTPVQIANQKIKKAEGNLNVELTKTMDILKTLGEKKYNGQLLVGFALETNNERENAITKLKTKNADMIVLNSLNDEGAGFGHDTNKITIFQKGGNEITFERKPKQQVAKDIVDTIAKMLHD
jgi:phosphopantothenoylcysteine decarboxylase/phosphopantothenate--cysteine ligase